MIEDYNVLPVPYDTVYDELVAISDDGEMSFVDALYLLGFSSYLGFGDIQCKEIGFSDIVCLFFASGRALYG